MSLEPERGQLFEKGKLYGNIQRVKELYIKYKNVRIPSVSVICEKASKYSKTYLYIRIILFLIIIYFLSIY